jgi:hypothetical protein
VRNDEETWRLGEGENENKVFGISNQKQETVNIYNIFSFNYKIIIKR